MARSENRFCGKNCVLGLDVGCVLGNGWCVEMLFLSGALVFGLCKLDRWMQLRSAVLLVILCLCGWDCVSRNQLLAAIFFFSFGSFSTQIRATLCFAFLSTYELFDCKYCLKHFYLL